MAGSIIFTFQPTFTQGLILGQFSVLLLLFLILKYLFLDSTEYPFETSIYHPRVGGVHSVRQRKAGSRKPETKIQQKSVESAAWFSTLLQQVVDVYRSKLRDDLPEAQGDEIARKRIEEYANAIRPPGFLDHIKIHSVDLGVSAPRLSNAREVQRDSSDAGPAIEFDLSYLDTLSVSLSTSYLFNYPMPSFARLPVSLTISLSLFKSSIIITPPSASSTAPVMAIAIQPDFTLNLTTTSLMGSRAKLSNVPKLHELIQHQVRRIVANKTTWKVVMPGLSTVYEAKKEQSKEEGIDL